MDYNKLLDFVTDLGYELSMAGAEIFRVEDSISRILRAYSLEPEVYAIPNCIIVSVTLPDGESLTEMRRIGFHGNDLHAVELLSGLSRRVCAEKPDGDTLHQWLRDVKASRRQFSWILVLLGYMMASFAFAIFFGGNLMDGLCGGIAGLAVGACSMFMDKLETNHFFKTMLAAIPLAFIPYAFGALGICQRSDMATIGTVMVLIPGLLFTYAMRDIIYGDTNAGINRIVQVLLIALAIACGTSVAWWMASAAWGEPTSLPAINHSFLITSLSCTIGGIGFSFLFNVRGKGIVLCLLGGVLCWGVYCIVEELGCGEMAAMLIGSVVAAIYSEVMARIRKCPAIAYLVMALVPLIPGSALYYTMNYAVRGNMSTFATQGMRTICLAGLMAAGVILVSTTMRMIYVAKRLRHKQ